MFIFYCTAVMVDRVVVASCVKWGFLRSTFYDCYTKNDKYIFEIWRKRERKSL